MNPQPGLSRSRDRRCRGGFVQPVGQQIVLENLNGAAARELLALILHLQSLRAAIEVDPHFSLHEKRDHEPVDIIPDIAGTEQFVELAGEGSRGLLAILQASRQGLFQPELNVVG